MKKITATILAVTLLIGMVTVYAGSPFSDLKETNWAYESVNAMKEKGVIQGFPDGSFKPNQTVTYGEFIKMALVATTGEDVGNAKTGNWATIYYETSIDNEFFSPHDINYNNLNKGISREDMAFIISNILGDVEVSSFDEIIDSISDVDSDTKYDYDIIKVYSKGILTGYSDGTFRPKGTLTRAEASTVINRLVDESQRVDISEVKIESKIENPMTISSGGKDIVVDKISVSLPFRDIESIQIPSGDKWIQIKSKEEQDFILYVGENRIIPVGNADGTSYFYHDNYYYYYFNPRDLELEDDFPIYLRFSIDEDQKIYLIQGVTL